MKITSKYAILATSAIAILTGSGCSSNLGKPSSDTAESSKKQNYQARLQKASLQRSNESAARLQKASYSSGSGKQYQVDQDFDTWDRVFKGFRFSNHYANNPRVQRFVTKYGRSPKQLNILSERASTFMHMIVHEVENRNMPTEIALLPFVESAFNPDVFSHAGAAGLWQFIPTTGHIYGLKQGKGYDARMDPFAATGAALSYLQKLHREFNGDWLLALAAYNCGENRVQREIDRNRAKGKPTTFWHLSGLPRETREYVPRLLAFKELIGNAQRYGIELHDTPNQARLAQIRVNKPVNLRQAAIRAGLPADTLTELNACFRTGVTTPQYSNRIVLPRRHAQKIVQAIEALPEASGRVYADKTADKYNTVATTRTTKKQRVHKVRRGDTLHAIARQHGVSVRSIMQHNGKRSSRILVGERLRIA